MAAAHTESTGQWEGVERAARMSGGTRHEIWVVLLLCVLGGIRVFLFSAAFPFFSNIDEQYHFDLVYKYSRGQIPRSEMERYSRESSELIVLCQTAEFMNKPRAGGRLPAPWCIRGGVEDSGEYEREVCKRWKMKNYESGSFPAYYVLAGAWFRLGRFLGLEGGDLLYWIRFLNAPLFAGLVWVSYLIGRMLFSAGSWQRVGLVCVVAFFPSDAFYGINCDVLSAPLFSAAFLMLLSVYFERRSWRYHLFAGLSVAGTFLTKLSNVAVVVLLAVVVVLKLREFLRRGVAAERIWGLVVLLAAAATPVLLWLGRNYFVFGDITGMTQKVAGLSWERKGFWEIWDHPILRPYWLCFFLRCVVELFWRGEFVWHDEMMRAAWADQFYVFSTGVFVVACGVGLVFRGSEMDRRRRFAIIMSFLMLAVSVMFLAFVSMVFDFGRCPNPSRAMPFLVSGRLIIGVLAAFLLIWIDGLERMRLALLGPVGGLSIVGVIMVMITVSEVVITWPVFLCEYNWFGLG